MSNETTSQNPAVELPDTDTASAMPPRPPAGAQYVDAPGPGAVAPASCRTRPHVWIAVAAGALVGAMILSGVSFGAGVLVGRHTGEFGGRGDFATAGQFGGAPQGFDGRQGLPDQDMRGSGDGFRGQQGPPQGMPGRGGMRDGRVPWSAQDSMKSAPPAPPAPPAQPAPGN